MTENQAIKKDILIALSDSLKQFGFKLKGDNFIRNTEPGLYQIINVGLGPTTSIMANHIGICFGIATEEWLDNLITWKRPKTLTVSDCEIKDINCELIKVTNETIWYPITTDLPSLKAKLRQYIETTFVPLLDKLRTRQDIISMWRLHKNAIGIPEGRHELVMGTLMYLTQEKREGELLLKNLLNRKGDNQYFVDAINKVFSQTKAAANSG